MFRASDSIRFHTDDLHSDFYSVNQILSQGLLFLLIFFFNIIAKNGVYISLVRDVRHAFEGSPLVKIDCKGMHASDYKKLGAKLKVCSHFSVHQLFKLRKLKQDQKITST